MYLKILIFLFAFLYQNATYSKVNETTDFNQKYLSNYFSGLISFHNQKNDDAIKFFNSSKFLIKKHDNFLRHYVFSLILDGQVKKAINQIKPSKEENFFEANLLLILDSLTKKKYKQVENRISKLLSYENDDSYQFVILTTLERYNYAFLYKKIGKKDGNLGRIDLITQAFQNCYLDSKKTNSHFLNIINFKESDYSRYLFFYLANIIKNEDYDTAIEISKTIEPLTSGLLIAQANKWIVNNDYNKFDEHFSCKNENDLLAEFFFSYFKSLCFTGSI